MAPRLDRHRIVDPGARPSYRNRVRYAWVEFLKLPALIVMGWMLAATIAIVLDRNAEQWGQPVRDAIAVVLPPEAIGVLLSTIAPGLLTLISIVFFVLIMAVQHQSGNYTPVVLDQFMRRRSNKIFFGMFVGLAVYTLLALGLIPPGRAIVSGALVILLSTTTMISLLVFVYSAVDQVRPSATVWMMQQIALEARESQQPLLTRCRGQAKLADAPGTTVTSNNTGYIVRIDGRLLDRALSRIPDDVEVEIEFHISMGDHVVPGGTLAEVRGGDNRDRASLCEAVLDCISLGRMRDIDRDAAQAVDSLGSMAWSATASAADPQGARTAVETLHSLLVAFQGQDLRFSPEEFGGQLPVVYRDDILSEVLDSLTSIITASALSGQHQTASTVITIFSRAIPYLEPENQRAALDRIQRVEAILMRHAFTVDLERAFEALNTALRNADLRGAARRIDQLKSDVQRYNIIANPADEQDDSMSS